MFTERRKLSVVIGVIGIVIGISTAGLVCGDQVLAIASAGASFSESGTWLAVSESVFSASMLAAVLSGIGVVVGMLVGVRWST